MMTADETTQGAEGSVAARIERAIAQLGIHREPPAGWESRVLARVSVGTEQRRRWWRIPVLVGGPLLAAAAVAAVVLLPSLASRAPVTLALRRLSSGTVLSGGGDGELALVAGDRVEVSARGGAAYRAVWVYRGRVLVAACPGPGSSCRARGGDLVVEVYANLPGDYRILVLSADRQIQPPPGDADGGELASELLCPETGCAGRVARTTLRVY